MELEKRGEKLDKILGENGFGRKDFGNEIIQNYLEGGRKLGKAIREKFRGKQIRDAVKEHLFYVEEPELVYEAFVRGKEEIEFVRMRLEGIKWLRWYVEINGCVENLLFDSGEDDKLIRRGIGIWIEVGRPIPEPPAIFDPYMREIEVAAINYKFYSGEIDRDFLTRENVKGYVDRVYDEMNRGGIFRVVSYDEYVDIANRIVEGIVFGVIRDDIMGYLKEKFGENKVSSPEQEGFDYDEDRVKIYNYTEGQLRKIVDRAIMDHNMMINKKEQQKLKFLRKDKLDNALRCSTDFCLNLGSVLCNDMKCGVCCVNANCLRHRR
ncbi:MAG: hypothetical protein Hyperionvirus18_16 [Hyperionvirus sp.]|uniref:Uncharacterized protein n=1 Tax=Hyperionvirus sp. TaxID=2487770 RepID=A0A3G5AA61_9VIRU|nr:MAG: hypothetical protein Hyperionvirus18_16 [Hyperionvirus sp.]